MSVLRKKWKRKLVEKLGAKLKLSRNVEYMKDYYRTGIYTPFLELLPVYI